MCTDTTMVISIVAIVHGTLRNGMFRPMKDQNTKPPTEADVYQSTPERNELFMTGRVPDNYTLNTFPPASLIAPLSSRSVRAILSR